MAVRGASGEHLAGPAGANVANLTRTFCYRVFDGDVTSLAVPSPCIGCRLDASTTVSRATDGYPHARHASGKNSCCEEEIPMSDLAVSPALPATTDGAAAVTSPADPADRPGRPRMWHRLRRAIQGVDHGPRCPAELHIRWP